MSGLAIVHRLSYDPTRRYRSPSSPQQGRVTLEATDMNEAQYDRRCENLIGLRRSILVGPCGTPDNGFLVKAGKAVPDFDVGPGTMYVGGLRVVQEKEIAFASQSEWLDMSTDPLLGRPDDLRKGFDRNLSISSCASREVVADRRG